LMVQRYSFFGFSETYYKKNFIVAVNQLNNF